MSYALTVYFRQGMGTQTTIQVSEAEWSNEQSLQKYTAGCLARGDTISVKDTAGNLYNYPAQIILYTTVGKAVGSSESATPKRSIMG